jgi:hypothetical protein
MEPAKPALLLGALLLLGACKDPPAPPTAGTAAPLASTGATAPADPARPAPPAALAGPKLVVEPNPLRRPPRKIVLDPGKRVFTFSDQMLASAKVGSTLVLYAATVAGIEGDDLIIEGRGGPSFKVHSAYVIPVPDDPRVKPGDPVVTEWNGVLKHAVVTKFVKDKIGVRYTDMDAKMPETFLQGGRGASTAGAPSKAARFVRQSEGLAPGNYAALRQGDEWRHVLLVSPSSDAPAPSRTWLALGFGGAALVVEEAALRPIPVKWTPKVGAAVWAEYVGTLRRATVKEADEQGLFTVKFERVGRPAAVGWGLLMPPLAEAAAEGAP